MPRFNQREMLPNARGMNLSNFTTRGNSYVHDYAPTQRMPDTSKYWRYINTQGNLGAKYYGTNGSNLHLYAQGNTYYTSPSIGDANEVWTSRAAPTNQITGIGFANNVWFMSGNDYGSGRIYTSPDAITWTNRVSTSTGVAFGNIFSRYNGYYGRWETSVMPSSTNQNVYSTYTDGGTWNTNPIGFPQANVSVMGASQIYYVASLYFTPPHSFAYGYPGPNAVTAITSPFGTSEAITGIGTTSVMSSYETIIASAANRFAISTAVPATTWTIIEPPPLSGTDYIREIFTRNGPNLGQTTYGAISQQNRVFSFDATLGTQNRVWREITPAKLRATANFTNVSGASYLSNYTTRLGISGGVGIYHTNIF